MGPVDTRRIVGPENSKDWKSFCQRPALKDVKRNDRKDDDHRGLCKSPFSQTKMSFEVFILPIFGEIPAYYGKKRA